MYLYKQKLKDGDTYLAIKEKYYVPNKGTRERTIEKIGRLSQLKNNMDDPVAHYTQYAKDLTEKSKEERLHTVTINMAQNLEPGTCDTRNVGYGILKELYRQLEINKFWNWKTRGLKTEFSTDQIFRLLTFSRAALSGFQTVDTEP